MSTASNDVVLQFAHPMLGTGLSMIWTCLVKARSGQESAAWSIVVCSVRPLYQPAMLRDQADRQLLKSVQSEVRIGLEARVAEACLSVCHICSAMAKIAHGRWRNRSRSCNCRAKERPCFDEHCRDDWTGARTPKSDRHRRAPCPARADGAVRL